MIGGSEGIPPREFLKNGYSEIESEGISESFFNVATLLYIKIAIPIM